MGCIYCEDTGLAACDECGGEGWIFRMEDDGHDSEWKCDECLGSGVLRCDCPAGEI